VVAILVIALTGMVAFDGTTVVAATPDEEKVISVSGEGKVDITYAIQ